MSHSPGVLYIVATPIGNLADITYRAIEVLGKVDLIAAEDTRHSKKLLAHYGINAPMMAFHEHNERERSSEMVALLQSGSQIALISDAGTPLISDPGYQLVAAVRAAGLQVISVPGASAVIAALSIAGLPTDRFCFEGFLPAKKAAREKQLLALQDEPRTMVLYEAPHRIQAALASICEVLGAERRMVLMRELTKLYETTRAGTCAELCDWLEQNPVQQKGEYVVVIAGAAPKAAPAFQLDSDTLLAILLEKMSVKDAAGMAARLTGETKNGLYQRALALTARERQDQP